MPLTYAAIIPHSPLLLPTVAKNHFRLVSKTISQIKSVAEELYASQPDVLILLTPHGQTVNNTFTAYVDDYLTGDLADFGDIATNIKVNGATNIAHHIKDLAEKSNINFKLQTVAKLDYGSTVPVVLLLDKLPTIKVLPINIPTTDSDDIIRFGQVIYEFMHDSQTRIAIIASADLSRRKKGNSNTNKFRTTSSEKMIANAITDINLSHLLKTEQVVDNCGYRPIFLLLASLQKLKAKGVIRSFEAPFGIGMITATTNIET